MTDEPKTLDQLTDAELLALGGDGATLEELGGDEEVALDESIARMRATGAAYEATLTHAIPPAIGEAA